MPDLMNSGVTPKCATGGFFAVDVATRADILPCPLFMRMLCLERNRAERSGRRHVLMLVEFPNLLKHQRGAAEKIQFALSRSTRETDIKGWYLDGAVIGVIFTEIPLSEASVVKILSSKVNLALRDELGAQQFGAVGLSFQVFPDSGEGGEGYETSSGDFSPMYPDPVHEIEIEADTFADQTLGGPPGKPFGASILGPLMIVIAAAVKLTAPGRWLFGK